MKYHGCERCIVKVQEIKKITTIIITLGFLGGILYVNMFAKNYVLSMGIFSDYFLSQYAGNSIKIDEYIWYILRIRILPIMIMIIIGNTCYRRIAGTIFILWTGFLSGVILSTAVLKLSIKGVVLCVISVLPHFICYVAAYAMLLVYSLTYPNTKWNKTKTISLILFVMLGIISECYINPVLLDIYIDLL